MKKKAETKKATTSANVMAGTKLNDKWCKQVASEFLRRINATAS
jgi:hypothetical protein